MARVDGGCQSEGPEKGEAHPLFAVARKCLALMKTVPALTHTKYLQRRTHNDISNVHTRKK